MSESIIASDNSAIDVSTCYDESTGTLDRRIFSDEGIYQEELKQIFGRAWNFICHDSQIPEAGNFFTNYIGEDEVIAGINITNTFKLLKTITNNDVVTFDINDMEFLHIKIENTAKKSSTTFKPKLIHIDHNRIKALTHIHI